MSLKRSLSVRIAANTMILLVWVFVLSISLYGQATATVSQGITGSVMDPSGALVPGASVSATNINTGVEVKTVTTQAGYFSFPGLVVGAYKITASKAGFRTVVQENIFVASGQTPNVAIQLAVGRASQTITVSAEAGTIDKTSTTTGDTVPAEEVASLPILMNGGTRSPLNFLFLFAGVSPNTYGDRGGAGLQWSEINGTGDGGGYGTVTGYKIDGIYMSGDQSQSLSAQYPAPQAIQEVRLVTNTNPDEGFDLGSVFELVTKSGTNQFHGEVYEYIRNEAFDARNFFSPSNPRERQNDFGGLVGGPIKKDKLFFFVNYQGFRESYSASTDLLSVPTAAMHAGDFSQELGPLLGTNATGQPVYQGEIFNPYTVQPDGKGGYVRDPFVGNVIPQSMWSAISKFYMAQLPLPNNGNGLSLNYIAHETPQTTHTDYLYPKIDYTISSKQRLSVSVDKPFRTGNSSCENILGNDYPGFGPNVNSCYIQTGSRLNGAARVSYSYSLAPNLLLELHAGLTYSKGDLFLGPQGAVSDSTAGIKGTFTDGVPQVSISNFQGWGTTQSTELNQGGTESAIASLTWIKGSHQIQFGSDFVLPWNLSMNEQYGAGVFSFGGSGTNQPDFTGGGPGQQPGLGIADFLLGWVSSGRTDAPFDQRSSSEQWAWYGEDQWRATPKLSVNYGLRWELYVPPHEEHDRVADFCPTCPNSAAGGISGALQFWGNASNGNGLTRDFKMYPWALAPRIGLAYAFRKDTVGRLYWGIQRYPINIVQVNGFYFPNYGWGASLQPTETNDISPAFQWDTSTFGTLPKLPDLDPTFLTGGSVPYWDPNDDKPADAQELGAQVQHQFSNGLVISAKYAGKLVHGLPTNNLVNLNQLPLQDMSLGPLLSQPANSAAAQAAGISLPYAGFTGDVYQALLPFPQYQTIDDIQAMAKNTYWHAGIFSAQQRFHNGLSFLVNYTISKMLTNDPYFISGQLGNYWVGSVQQTSLRQKTGTGFPMTFESGLGGDRPQMLNISYTYELPVGTGKRFLANANPVVRGALGGWTISGIQSYGSGTPIWVTSTQGFPGYSIWPDRVNGQPIHGNVGCSNYDPGNPNDHYLNINAFANPPLYQLGTMEPSLANVRTCGIINESFSIFKAFPFHEHYKMQVGADIINAFNRHSFYGLQADVGIPSLMGTFTNATDGRSIQLNAQFFF